MKCVLLFEGIAASGKTTLEEKLRDQLAGAHVVEMITEADTLMPIFDNHDPVTAVAHLSSIVDRIIASPADVVIVDRFLLTHAFRTMSSVDAFAGLAKTLMAQTDCRIVLLIMDESVIADRIHETTARRSGHWNPGGQGSFEARIAYYVDQQRTLQQLARAGVLPFVEVDTTGKDWPTALRHVQETCQGTDEPL